MTKRYGICSPDITPTSKRYTKKAATVVNTMKKLLTKSTGYIVKNRSVSRGSAAAPGPKVLLDPYNNDKHH